MNVWVVNDDFREIQQHRKSLNPSLSISDGAAVRFGFRPSGREQASSSDGRSGLKSRATRYLTQVSIRLESNSEK